MQQFKRRRSSLVEGLTGTADCCMITFCVKTRQAPTLEWIWKAAIYIETRSWKSPNIPISARWKLPPKRWRWRGKRNSERKPIRGRHCDVRTSGTICLPKALPCYISAWATRRLFVSEYLPFLRRYPDEFYLNSILLITLALMSVVVLLLMDPQVSPRAYSFRNVGVISAMLAGRCADHKLFGYVVPAPADIAEARSGGWDSCRLHDAGRYSQFVAG